jgi:transcriptional regulator with PAS, ATPase and Fis domain
LNSQKAFAITYPIRTAAGHKRWVLEQGMGVYDSQGELTGAEAVITDVTEKQQRELALENENRHLKSGIMSRNQFGDIVGGSAPMQKVYDRIIKAAACEDSVIIYGPSGTGKELVARAIHKNSHRSSGPFIPINCGAIPEALIESEFFGHAKGAFSGANTDKNGVLDMADGGTLFLDELGEISMAMQIKLLRVMDGNGYIPVGGTTLKKPNIRFISATNRDLQQRVREKKMREDFFFRIHIIPVTLPPLKERREDIPLLIEHFLNAYPDHTDRKTLTSDMIKAMQAYAWPGNVRQLQNMIYQFLVLGKMDFLDPGTLSRGGGSRTPTGLLPLKSAVQEFEKEYIARALKQNRQQKKQVAQILGMDRKTLFRKIKRYGLD